MSWDTVGSLPEQKLIYVYNLRHLSQALSLPLTPSVAIKARNAIKYLKWATMNQKYIDIRYKSKPVIIGRNEKLLLKYRVSWQCLMWPLMMNYEENWLVSSVWVRGLQTATCFMLQTPYAYIPLTASLISGHGFCVCVSFNDHQECEFSCWLKRESRFLHIYI